MNIPSKTIHVTVAPIANDKYIVQWVLDDLMGKMPAYQKSDAPLVLHGWSELEAWCANLAHQLRRI